MKHKDRAIGILFTVFVISTSWLLIEGFGFELNFGIFVGPLFIAFIEFKKYVNTTIIMRNDEKGSEVIFSGQTEGVVRQFEQMGYRRVNERGL